MGLCEDEVGAEEEGAVFCNGRPLRFDGTATSAPFCLNVLGLQRIGNRDLFHL